MLEKVSSKIDFIAAEHEILNFWEKRKIFQKRVRLNKGKKRWSFLDGPITANNPMGVHHAWGRTFKDIFQRYHAMKGYDQRYQNGFDCQGLWVEVEVEKELGFKSKTDIDEYGVEKFVEACKARVKKYSEIQTQQSIRLGYWMDWDNSYFTMSDENNFTIWHFLKKCNEKGWIYKGHDVMPWCVDCGAAMSEHEIATEGYAERTHISVYLKFPLKGKKNESLLVWTTTPWTLTSNVAAAVHPEMKYIKVRQNDDILYLAESRKDILKEKGKYEILGTVTGTKLIGLEYSGPFDDFEVQSSVKHRVIEWDGVNDEEGTGIVHIAPGCGHEDYLLSKDENLEVIAPLDQFGNYIEGFGKFTGKNVRDVDDEIITHLKETKRLYKRKPYTHRYPICWRHKTDLVFRMIDEWFISMDELRFGIMEITKQINWIPSWGMDRELDWLKNMSDWMISKKRYWGLALPIYECEQCGEFEVIGSNDELKSRAVEGWEQFEGQSPHRPWVDSVKIKCNNCKNTVSRILDVGNPWLDAGIVPYSTLHYLTDREYWEKWFTPDFITECFPGQFRNWFYCLLAMSTAMENKPPFKTVLGHALVKDEHGKDMHKSEGNAIWFDDAAEELGVDVMRWMFALQKAEQNLNFGYGPAKEIRKRINTLWNAYSFFVTYAKIDNFELNKIQLKDEDYIELDKWILSKLNKLLVIAEESYESYRIEQFMRPLDKFLDDLSNWYIRRNRRRFWKSENDANKYAAYFTLYSVLTGLIKMLAPVVPFMTEKIYQNLVLNLDSFAPESIHLCDFPTVDEKLIDSHLMESIDLVVKIVELGRYARNQANIKIRQPLSKLEYFVKDKQSADTITKYKNQILDELNLKEIVEVDSDTELLNYTVKPNFSSLGEKYGDDIKKIIELFNDLSFDDIRKQLNDTGVFTISKNGQVYELSKDEILITEDSVEGKSTVSHKNIVVSVCTVLTEELIHEGFVRDMVRQVQNMRKEADFNVDDRIKVSYNGDDEIKIALENFGSYFRNEVLAVELITKIKKEDYSKEVTIGNKKVTFGISKVT